MPPDPDLVDDDEDYASSEDSDFAPDAAPQAGSEESSDSESEAGAAEKHSKKSKKRKRTADDEAEDVGFENSGDEEIVEKGLKRQKRKQKKGEEDEDEGGEGGFVKTRRMAAQAIEEKKKPLIDATKATIDVDALWAEMMNGSTKKAQEQPEVTDVPLESEEPSTSQPTKDAEEGVPTLQKDDEYGEEMIKIQRTYKFAGKVHTEEKLVHRDSAEAKLWLQSQNGDDSAQGSDTSNLVRLRPPKKARRSIFEPLTEPLPQRKDLHFRVPSRPAGTLLDLNSVASTKKLNTVEKSKMDWAGFVDKEGLKDELETAGKAKDSYLDRQEFLARVEDKREEEARRARLKLL